MTEPMPPELDEEPFRLSNAPRPAKPVKKPTNKLSPSDMRILETYIHREDYTRKQLAEKFGIKLKELQRIIKRKGWQSNGDEHDEENNTPLPNPHPSVFVPCPYKAGSEAKIWMLSERYARRLPLWHPNDNQHKIQQRSEDSL